MRVLIVGGGAAGLCCAIRLRQLDPALQVTVDGNAAAVACYYKYLRLAHGLCQLNAAKQGIIESCTDVIQLTDSLLLENLVRGSGGKEGIALDGHDAVGCLFRQINFMQAHEYGDVLLPCHFREDGQ